MTDTKPKSPHSYPRRILLAVEAYSPQTITETLYALTQTAQPAFIPTEVHIITTERGRDLVRQALLYEGWLQRLCTDYGLPDACAKPHFHVMTDDQGKALWDIRSAEDNEHTANYISQQLQQFTADPHASITVLLSGGRRTMTYYIGYALSLFGRPQDRLKHVRVDDCYYYLSDFYYPPPRSQWQIDKDKKPFDASKVEVTLADIPFVRLRDGLPTELLQGQTSFSAAVQAAQRHLDPISVQLDWKTAQLTCGGRPVNMQPVNLAFYVWMLERCRDGVSPFSRKDLGEYYLRESFLTVYRRLYGMTGHYESTAELLQKEGNQLLPNVQKWFDERKSNTNKALEQALGKLMAKPYCVQGVGKRPLKYGLALSSTVLDGV